MKWGRMKSPPSSSRSSVITRVFPVSWFSKFRKGGNPDTSSSSSAKRKQSRGKLDFPTPNSSIPSGNNWREGRFYSMDDDDAFWRLSFGDERVEGRRSTGGINPLWYDSDDELQIPISSFKRFGLGEMELPRREVNRNFNDMVSDIKKMKEKQNKEKVLKQSSAFSSKRVNMETEWKNDLNDRKLSHRVMREKQEGAKTGPDHRGRKSVERDIFAIEPEIPVHLKTEQNKISFPNFRLSRIEEDYAFEDMKGESSTTSGSSVSVPEWKIMQGSRFLKEIKVKTECPSRKMKQSNNRVKAYSPRTECKIRALEDMKKARMKLKKKKKEKEEVMDGRTVFDSFAVVKSSFNPQEDFRDSMVEMISQRGIRQPEELEELLACYLTMNCDEYHELIIKVFRQVWFELNGVCDDPEIHSGQYSYYDSEIV